MACLPPDMNLNWHQAPRMRVFGGEIRVMIVSVE